MGRRSKRLALTTLLLIAGAGIVGCGSSPRAGTNPYGDRSMVAGDSLGTMVFRADKGTQSAWTPYAGRLDPPGAPDTQPRLAARPD